VVLGHRLKVVVTCGSAPNLNLTLDGRDQPVSWQRLAHRNRWLGEIQVVGRGRHVLEVDGRCGLWRVRQERHFTNALPPVEIAESVVERFFHIHHLDRLDWNWGEAVFLYGLAQLAAHSEHEIQYVDILSRYHGRHADRGLGTIDWADKCPAALSALVLQQEYGRDTGWANVERVVKYLVTAPRNELGSLDHLGQETAFSFFVPGSMWVDSLMMWALLAVQYGLEHNDVLAQFGLDQPRIFANLLRDAETGLFHHAWHLAEARTFPHHNAFWLRGNGWVLVSLVEIPDRFRGLARDSLQAIVSRLRRRPPGFTMEEISRGTNPSSRWGYRLVPKDRNISYGVGALLMLSAELAGDEFS
jgi:hypothetical protein